MRDCQDYNALEASFSEALSPLYDRREARQLFSILLDHYLGWMRVDFALKRGQKPEGLLVEQVNFTAAQLLKNRPIQYILGCAHFCGLKLKVVEGVLIPRPETEELVAKVLSEADGAARSVLDIGTGSGAIALALCTARPDWTVMGIDVAEGALRCARENAEAQGLAVAFKHLDSRAVPRWRCLPEFDLLVSNPPYVQQAEKAEMEPRVLDYEPHLALFAPPGRPLHFYEVIADFALQKLKPTGSLYLEINAYLARETLELLHQKGFEVELQRDLSGKDRFAIAKRPSLSSAPGPS